MPEPIKTRGKLERADWRDHRRQAGMAFDDEVDIIIDAACEVLNRWDADFAQTGYRDDIEALRNALTTAGCVKELEVERFYIEENPTGKWGIVDSLNSEAGYLTQKGAVAKLNELNRLSQQQGES